MSVHEVVQKNDLEAAEKPTEEAQAIAKLEVLDLGEEGADEDEDAAPGDAYVGTTAAKKKKKKKSKSKKKTKVAELVEEPVEEEPLSEDVQTQFDSVYDLYKTARETRTASLKVPVVNPQRWAKKVLADGEAALKASQPLFDAHGATSGKVTELHVQCLNTVAYAEMMLHQIKRASGLLRLAVEARRAQRRRHPNSRVAQFNLAQSNVNLMSSVWELSPQKVIMGETLGALRSLRADGYQHVHPPGYESFASAVPDALTPTFALCLALQLGTGTDEEETIRLSEELAQMSRQVIAEPRPLAVEPLTQRIKLISTAFKPCTELARIYQRQRRFEEGKQMASHVTRIAHEVSQTQPQGISWLNQSTRLYMEIEIASRS